MSENVPSNSPRFLKPRTPGTPTDTTPTRLQETAQKQEELVRIYRDMNVELNKFKAKTEESLRVEREHLQNEKRKTQMTIEEMQARNMDALKSYKEKHAQQLAGLAKQPLFACSKVRELSQTASTMKTETQALKTEFSQKFDALLTEFRATKVIAQGVLQKTLAARTEVGLNPTKIRVCELQRKIMADCERLTRQTRSISTTRRADLQISAPVQCLGSSPKPQTQATGSQPKKILRVSNFLSRFFAENAELLSQ